MENILFIAHLFPPMGGPGSKRPTQFVKNFRDQGYNPIILTITNEDIKNGPYPLDESRMDGLDKIEIIRTRTGEPRKLRGLAEKLRVFRLFWFFLNPIFWEKSALWPFVSYQTAKKIIDKYNIQKVITTSSPFSALLLGWLIKKRLDDCDVLFLPLETSKGEQKPLFIPGKLYDYLQLGKPVLVLGEASDATEILEKSGLCVVCSPFDTIKIVETLKYLIDNQQSLSKQFSPNEEYIASFCFSRLTEKLSEVLDAL